MATTGAIVYRQLRFEALTRRRRGIRQDPEAYPEPDRFNIDRWLDEKGQLRDDLQYFNYGFGRRCVFSPKLRCIYS